MFRKVLAGLAAVICAGGIAFGSNLTLFSGPQDPSQLLAQINQLIRNINTGVSGRLTAVVTAAGSTTTALESTMMTYSLPASQLAADGDAVRVVCWGTSASNTNTKYARLYFGASMISSSTTAMTRSPNGQKWRLELVVARSGAAAQNVVGTGIVDNTPVSTYTTTAGSDALTSAVTIKCAGFTPTAVQDITAQGMLVEQIK